jgi:hypothetical protein
MYISYDKHIILLYFKVSTHSLVILFESSLFDFLSSFKNSDVKKNKILCVLCDLPILLYMVGLSHAKEKIGPEKYGHMRHLQLLPPLSPLFSQLLLTICSTIPMTYLCIRHHSIRKKYIFYSSNTHSINNTRTFDAHRGLELTTTRLITL